MSALPFKKTCPCTIHPPPFFNFSGPPPPGKVIKIYLSPPPRLKIGGGGGGGGLNYDSVYWSLKFRAASMPCENVNFGKAYPYHEKIF